MLKNWKDFGLLMLVFLLLFIGFNKTPTCLAIMFFCLIYFMLNQHLTILLVQLEALGLGSLLIIALSLIYTEKDLTVLFSIMVITVIEASVGLSLTVKQARYSNNELLKFHF